MDNLNNANHHIDLFDVSCLVAHPSLTVQELRKIAHHVSRRDLFQVEQPEAALLVWASRLPGSIDLGSLGALEVIVCDCDQYTFRLLNNFWLGKVIHVELWMESEKSQTETHLTLFPLR